MCRSKTTMTEKLLLYGGAIHEAGEVKARAHSRSATSDFMELEKARGISISSTAMTWQYQGGWVSGCAGRDWCLRGVTGCLCAQQAIVARSPGACLQRHLRWWGDQGISPLDPPALEAAHTWHGIWAWWCKWGATPAMESVVVLWCLGRGHTAGAGSRC